MILFASIVSKPSVFCTQFLPKGAFVAVAFVYIWSNHMFVPFMMLMLASHSSAYRNLFVHDQKQYLRPKLRLNNIKSLHRNIRNIPPASHQHTSNPLSQAYSSTYQTKGIGRPGLVVPASAVYQTSPFPLIPPVPCPSTCISRPLITNPALWF